jgi:DNA repair protein RecO (recombination protein O)
MAATETEALILRTYNFGEADKIVVCLTRSAGLIRGVAKGCRKLKSRFGASLEPFTLTRLNYYYKENQELVSIRQAEILTSHFDLFSQADALAGLAYMGDLVIEFSPPYQPNERLFRMVKACLDATAESPDDLQLILRYFEVWLLKLEGYLPDLRRCGECHRGFGDNDIAYLASDLMFRCRECSRGIGSALSRRLQVQLRATQKLAPFVFVKESREVPAGVHKEMAELTRQLISRVLERQPRLRSTLQ